MVALLAALAVPGRAEPVGEVEGPTSQETDAPSSPVTGGPIGPKVMIRREAERPITLPDDTFAVWGTVGGGMLTEVDPALLLASGASYGMDDDFEIGFVLLRLVLSAVPDTGLSDPEIFFAYRLVSGPVEVAARAMASVPFGGPFESQLSAAFLVRLGSLGRVDVVPDVHAISGPPWVIGSSIPASLRIQLGDAVTIGPVGIVSWPDLSRPQALFSVGGAVAYAFGDDIGDVADLRLTLHGPAFAVSGDLPGDPTLLTRFSGSLELRWFTEGPRDTAPFAEEL